MPMIDPAEDWTLTKIQAYIAGGCHAGRNVFDVVSDFREHPKLELAVKIGAAMAEDGVAPKKEDKPKEIRFTPNAARYARWTRSAEAAGIPLTAWIQLVADGWLKISVPVESPTVSVQETTQDGEGPIWRRILNDMEGRGATVLKKSDIPKLAARLGLSTQRVVSSLGSMKTYGTIENKGTHFQLTAKE